MSMTARRSERRDLEMDATFTDSTYDSNETQLKQSAVQSFQRAGPSYSSVERVAEKWKNIITTRRIREVQQDRASSSRPSSLFNNSTFRNARNVAYSSGLSFLGEQHGFDKLAIGGLMIGSAIMGNEPESELNEQLLRYVAEMCTPDKTAPIDLQHITILVKEGADINAADQYGQTVLHEAARLWHTDVAKYLIHELKADPNRGDKFGRTPLHIAAYVEYADMCKCLIEAGADINARTIGEEQTPVFFAARSDSVESLKCLIKRGCEFKRVVDYKKRTPLMVAVRFECYTTVEYLLEMGAPVDGRDASGQPGIVPLIMKMAPLAFDALNQFYSQDRITKTECHYLSKLEPTAPEEADSKKYPSALEVIVSSHQYQLVMHPTILHLINFSWKSVARSRAYLELALHFLFIISWSITAVAKDWKYLHAYNLPSEAWRIIFVVIGLVLFLLQIIMEIFEIIATERRFRRWVSWQESIIKDDKTYCHPQWHNERRWIRTERTSINTVKYSYLDNYGNIYDWICYVMLAISIGAHWSDVSKHSLERARWHIRLMAVTIILLWVRFMRNLRHLDWVGPFIVILGRMILKVLKFIVVYLSFYIPFAIAFWIVLGGSNNIPEFYIRNATTISQVPVTNLTINGFDQVHNLLLSLFLMTLVSNFDLDAMLKVDHVMAQLLVGFWLAISTILCVNLFIALLSDTFQRVHDNAKSNAAMQKAMKIVNIMQFWPTNCTRKYYVDLQARGSEYLVNYDPKKTVSGQKIMQKATIEVRDTVKELKEQFTSVFIERAGATSEQNVDSRPASRDRKEVKATSSVKISLPEDSLAREMQVLRGQLTNVRDEQLQMNERIARVGSEMNAMKFLLKDIAVVLTGGMPPSLIEEMKKKKKKKKRTQSDEWNVGATGDGEMGPRGVVRVAPMPQPTTTSDGRAFLPSVNVPDPRDSENV